MSTLTAIIRRNTKLFFKDKGMLFTSLITPLILLVLYTTFLGNIYHDTFASFLPEAIQSDSMDSVIRGCVAGQLVSSLLAVSCVTVAFCSNLLMVQDKVSGARADLTIAPVSPSLLALGYYVSTALCTLLICLFATAAGMIYIACVGWYLSLSDVLLMLADVVLLVLFGTALSSIIGYFLSSQGQISAVGTIVSAGYGFICGAYMPISSFGERLQTVLSFLPGTYATSLLRNHAMQGALNELEQLGLPSSAVDGIRDAVDCHVYFFDSRVPQGAMFAILGSSVALLMVVYVLINVRKNRHDRKEKRT